MIPDRIQPGESPKQWSEILAGQRVSSDVVITSLKIILIRSSAMRPTARAEEKDFFEDAPSHNSG
jgi:hypothetical protein